MIVDDATPKPGLILGRFHVSMHDRDHVFLQDLKSHKGRIVSNKEIYQLLDQLLSKHERAAI